MSEITPVKRTLTVPKDWKNLLCKICKNDKMHILNLKTCGCLFCNTCDDHSRDICISCQSKIDSKVNVKFIKNPRCKYYEHNQCFSSADYICKCIEDGFVCDLCLGNIHRKSMRKPCVPDILRYKDTKQKCQNCFAFIAEFRMISQSESLICFDCKTKIDKNIKLEKLVDEEPEWVQFDQEYEQSTKNMTEKIIKIERELQASKKDRDDKMRKIEQTMLGMQKFLELHIKEYDKHINALNEQLGVCKKISNNLRPDGTIKTIVDLIKDGQLSLLNKRKLDQLFALLKSYRAKENFDSLITPITKLVDVFVIYVDSKMNYNGSITGTKDNLDIIIIDKNKPLYVGVSSEIELNRQKKILADIMKHQNKWVRKDQFNENDNVIVSYANDTNPNYKLRRAKIKKAGVGYSIVQLLDVGIRDKVPNSSIGEIKEIDISERSTCFTAEIQGRIKVNCNLKQVKGSRSAYLYTYDTIN